METLNICVATYKLFEGNGIDVSVMQFAKELSRRHNVTMAAVYADKNIQDVDIKQYPANSPAKMRQVSRELEKGKFDLISTHYSPFDLVATMGHTPHFLHDPGVPPSMAIRKFSDLYLWSIVNTSRMIAARKATRVLPISRYLANEFRKKYLYRRGMDVLPYCIEFPEQIPGPVELPFENYVLYVGRHTPYKGVHELIDIFGEARKEIGEDVHLVTIGLGEPRYMELLRQKAAKSGGNVHLLGFVKDVWSYYAGASVYATCSTWEGQDRPVIEAQYSGKPVVTYENCSHPEVVTYGSLATNRKEFKDALVRHLTSDRDDGATTIKQKMTARYSPGVMADEFIRIAKGTINGGSSS
ncbi:MAG TPA: glycosyltransferase family 4 protein [Methanocella sp.]|nr:glycosyltransferase family 4 protein [Methanocella sp.]